MTSCCSCGRDTAPDRACPHCGQAPASAWHTDLGAAGLRLSPPGTGPAARDHTPVSDVALVGHAPARS